MPRAGSPRKQVTSTEVPALGALPDRMIATVTRSDTRYNSIARHTWKGRQSIYLTEWYVKEGKPHATGKQIILSMDTLKAGRIIAAIAEASGSRELMDATRPFRSGEEGPYLQETAEAQGIGQGDRSTTEAVHS